MLHVSGYTQRHKNAVRLAEAVGPTSMPLVMAGTASDGPILRRLQELAARHDTIRLLGNVDRDTLNGMYAACRVFCLPSEIEGTGLVALEAASYGAAIVITPHGGPPDYLLEHAEYVEAAGRRRHPRRRRARLEPPANRRPPRTRPHQPHLGPIRPAARPRVRDAPAGLIIRQTATHPPDGHPPAVSTWPPTAQARPPTDHRMRSTLRLRTEWVASQLASQLIFPPIASFFAPGQPRLRVPL